MSYNKWQNHTLQYEKKNDNHKPYNSMYAEHFAYVYDVCKDTICIQL